MFVAEQRGQPRMGCLDPGFHALGTDIHPQRQGVDEHPQRPVRTVAGLQTAQQYGAEHHVLFAGHLAQHLRPGQVHQARRAHTELPRLGPQAFGQRQIHRLARFIDTMSVALHILQSERQCRLIDLAKHLAEKRFVIVGTQAEFCLGHIVAVRHRLAELIVLAQQVQLHFVLHHVQRGVVQRQMVEQQDRDPAVLRCIVGVRQMHEGRVTQVEAVMPRIETAAQLCGNIAGGRVEFDVFRGQQDAAPYHLHRFVEPLPDHRGAQNVMTPDNHLQGLDECVETLTAVEGELCLQHVRVALLGGQVVIKDAFLQRRQRVDVLHIARTAGDGGDDAVDGFLSERGERQQVRGDVFAVQRNQVGRNRYFLAAADRRRQCGQGRLAEQHAYIGAQFGLAHAFDQRHRQQRMTAELEEVVVAPDAFDLEHVGPQACEGFLDFALRCFVLATGVGVCVRGGQCTAVEFAVGGQREQVQHHEGAGHHVVGHGRGQFGAQVLY
ncbi:hypothetical protein FX983_06545 [Pseudomonas frederiksbergensis]|uniref:Uncharacterized protein n=1 Tax=Pseudomonas frederiksbergensis TaxID=104087 RepID=A0A6L5BL75_9PSED|nr:hypothetical protein FX983_06545 [Pseudomonas frederiksbergensis]